MSIQYAGQYEVKELLVYTSSGAVLNLRNAIQSINIYESMFSTSLSGSITILDVDDIATIMKTSRGSISGVIFRNNKKER